MTSFLSALNPINSFPDYHGPYSVGTVDVELPVTDLPCAASAPEDAQPTVAFRIFYPCVPPENRKRERPVQWIPNPQYENIRSLFKFLETSDRVASLSASLARHLRHIKIPAHRNAKVAQPKTTERRWPVTVFSHGLAGSRNSYSYICGDLASFGTVVIAPDHRDGSSPIQYVRATKNTDAVIVDAVKISHKPDEATWKGRDKQLRIRMYEIATIFEALLKMDAGEPLENLDDNCSHNLKERVEVLKQFAGMLDLHRPGKVSWAGHSFGAATTAQLVKSIYYEPERPADADHLLITPSSNAAICQQITPDSPTLLLDTWCLPFMSPDQAWLEKRSLPSYAKGGPDGANVLSVLSEAFYNWDANTVAIKHIVAPPSSDSRRPSLRPRGPSAYLPKHAQLRDASPTDSGYASDNSQAPRRSRRTSQQRASPERKHGEMSPAARLTPRPKGPHMFYPQRSQHLNQSDFGVLFPWLTYKLTKAEEPERILELNVRAMVQVMTDAGVEMSVPEREDDEFADILDPEAIIRRWIPVDVDLEDEEGNVLDEKAGERKPLEEVDAKLAEQVASAEAMRESDPVAGAAKDA